MTYLEALGTRPLKNEEDDALLLPMIDAPRDGTIIMVKRRPAPKKSTMRRPFVRMKWHTGHYGTSYWKNLDVPGANAGDDRCIGWQPLENKAVID